jgi:transcription elongation factor
MKAITDSEGNSIQVIDLTKAIFEGRGERYSVGIEALSKDWVAIYTDDIMLMSNRTGVAIPEERRKEVVATAIKLFESAGINVEVHPPLIGAS